MSRLSWPARSCYGSVVRVGRGSRAGSVPIRRAWEHLHTQSEAVSLRKVLNKEAKARRKGIKASSRDDTSPPSRWELTVGIEIHARLNTARKLFSPALLDGRSSNSRSSSAPCSSPNSSSNIAPFDLAIPGTRPQLQHAALVPAIRAALALGCTIQRRSSWDRKHYFYQDQPNGYQITQFYEPFALDGKLRLATGDCDGSSSSTSSSLLSSGGLDVGMEIGIKQVQLEQDTAKTVQQGGGKFLIDYSRVGAPLIEIITLPQIHSPAAAAATVRQIRDRLRLVGACNGNMEDGELRADVNVSVRRRHCMGEDGIRDSQLAGGVTGLGTRTEIKNLNSFRSVEEAVAAERDRQISILEGGGTVLGETRGWVVGGTETTRLRGKEEEVDYRYMPDPDLGPLYISDELVELLRRGLPEPREATLARITKDFAISPKDAATLLYLDDGERLEFAAEVRSILLDSYSRIDATAAGRAAANWTLHELGGLLTSAGQEWSELRLSAGDLAAILGNLLNKQITGRSAKQLLATFASADTAGRTVGEEIERSNLRLQPLSDAEYRELAVSILKENPDKVAAIIQKGERGKIMFFVGQMIRRADEGTIEADKARRIIEDILTGPDHE